MATPEQIIAQPIAGSVRVILGYWQLHLSEINCLLVINTFCRLSVSTLLVVVRHTCRYKSKQPASLDTLGLM